MEKVSKALFCAVIEKPVFANTKRVPYNYNKAARWHVLINVLATDLCTDICYERHDEVELQCR